MKGITVHPINQVFDLHQVAGPVEVRLIGDTVFDRPQEETCLRCVEDGRRQLDRPDCDLLTNIAVSARAGKGRTGQVLDLGLPGVGPIAIVDPCAL